MAAIIGAIVVILGISLIALIPSEKAASEESSATQRATPIKLSEEQEHIAKLHAAKQSPPIQPGWVTIVPNGVKEVHEIGKDDEPLGQMKALGVPSILRHSRLVRHWPILKWDLLNISKTNVSLPGCRMQTTDSVFVLGRDRDKGGMIGSNRDLSVAYVNVTLSQFLHSALRPNVWLYWTGELAHVEEAAQLNATVAAGSLHPGWEKFRIFEDGLLNKSENHNEIFRPMLWLSHSGVVSQTHYDSQHNFFIQIQGQKRFLLFPPSTEVYSYPNIHRSYRQSQVHLERPWNESFSRINASATQAYEVILKPGDVLYIPPYWNHRVESLSLSLSLSVLSPSQAEASLAEVYWQQVPFGQFTNDRRERVQAAILYLRSILEKVHASVAPQGWKAFVDLLHEIRYRPLNLTHTIPITAQELCSLQVDDEVQAKLSQMEGQFDSAAENIAYMLGEVDVEAAIKTTFLRDYTEQIVRWAVGPQLVDFFLMHCMR